MRNRFLNFFSDPEDNDPSFVRLVQIILIFVIVANTGLLIVSTGLIVGTFEVLNIITAGVTLLLEIIALILAWRGRVGAAKFIVPIALLIAITYLAISGFGLRDTSLHAVPAIIVIAALLLKDKARFTITPLVLISLALIALADMTGINPSPFAKSTGVAQVVTVGIFFLAASEILQLLISRLNENTEKARRNEQAQIAANTELRTLQASLEQRVAERTLDLEIANQRNEKRAKQFEAIAQVARATVANQPLEMLLANMVNLVSQQFGFYHAGIFLLDEKREFADLRAANSEGGRRMLARGHKLAVGQSGIVGFVAATGKPRIALDVGDDAAYFNNPDLPSTRSEIALPLRVAEQIIGILDVQSITSNAFQEEDVEVLSTLADQVAVGIQNALSYETTQRLLQEAQQASGTFLRESWKVLGAQREGLIGFQVKDSKISSLTRPLDSNEVGEALARRTIVRAEGDYAALAVPIRLRDEVIGIMDIRNPDEYEWDDDEVDIAKAVVERLSLALESALLLKSTQRRAEIERMTADITSKIGATAQFDSILRTAAEELSRALGGSEVLVQLQSELLEK